jgi:hypothetical protein
VSYNLTIFKLPIITAVLTITLLLPLQFISYLLAEEPSFIKKPQVISKSASALGSTLTINYIISFIIAADKPISVFLSTSYGILWYKCASSKQPEQRATFPSTNGEMRNELLPENGQISYKDDRALPLNISVKADHTYCLPGKEPIIIANALHPAELKNIELHFRNNDGSQLTPYSLGNHSITSINRFSKPPSQFLQ